MATVRSELRDIDDVRDEICARIDQFERDFRLLSLGELGRRAASIRHRAAAGGFATVARLATGLSEAIAAGGRGAMIRPYLDGMRDALRSDRQDDASASSFLAAVGVRLAG